MEQTFFNNLPDAMFLPSLVLLAVMVWLISSRGEPPAFWRQLRGQLDQLGNELDRRFDRDRWLRRIPVYSAETIRGKEAQLVRDRLPRKAPRVRFVLLLLVIGVFVWWLTR
jgi:hypothetical protein